MMIRIMLTIGKVWEGVVSLMGIINGNQSNRVLGSLQFPNENIVKLKIEQQIIMMMILVRLQEGHRSYVEASRNKKGE
jgi:hypothetical protein